MSLNQVKNSTRGSLYVSNSVGITFLWNLLELRKGRLKVLLKILTWAALGFELAPFWTVIQSLTSAGSNPSPGEPLWPEHFSAFTAWTHAHTPKKKKISCWLGDWIALGRAPKTCRTEGSPESRFGIWYLQHERSKLTPTVSQLYTYHKIIIKKFMIWIYRADIYKKTTLSQVYFYV